MLAVGHFGQETERVSSKWPHWMELYIVWH